MKTLKHLNRKVLYLGLSGIQLAVITMAVLWAFIAHWVIGTAMLAAAVYIILLLKAKIKDGEPDPVQSYFIKSSSPKKLEDNNNALRYL